MHGFGLKRTLASKLNIHPIDQHLVHGSNMLLEGELRTQGVASGAVLTLIQTPKTKVLTCSEDGTANCGMLRQENAYTILKVISALSPTPLFRRVSCGF